MDQGLLIRHVGRGTYIATATDNSEKMGVGPVTSAPSLAEILEARMVLEPALARLATARITTDEITQLETRIQALQNVGTVSDLEVMDSKVLTTLAAIVGNSILLEMANTLATAWRQHAVGRFADIPVSAERKRSAICEARELLDALRALNAIGAERTRSVALFKRMAHFSGYAQAENRPAAEALQTEQGEHREADSLLRGDNEANSDC